MSTRIFIATTGNGLARAVGRSGHPWEVQPLLQGRQVTCLATDPHQAEVIYAGTQGDGVLRSEDNGITWRQVGLREKIVKSLTVSPIERDVIYAGTKPAMVWISRDAGKRWTALRGFLRVKRWFWASPAEKPLIAYVQAIGLSPSDPGRVVAGIDAGATVLSTDGGTTWLPHRRGSLRDCHSLTFHHSDGRYVYECGGTGGGAAMSEDGGRTWQKHSKGLDRHYGWAVAADPERPDTWYVSLSTGAMAAHGSGSAKAQIYRSTKEGGWQKLSGGLPQPLDHMPYALITDLSEPGNLYAGLSNGDVWHTGDYGDSWAKLPVNLGSIHRVMVMLSEEAS